MRMNANVACYYSRHSDNSHFVIMIKLFNFIRRIFIIFPADFVYFRLLVSAFV